MAPRQRLKLSGTLAEIAAMHKRPSVLLGKITEHLHTKANAPSDRRQDIIHPSEMAKKDWCPRQTFYRIHAVKNGIEVEDANRFAMVTENIFAEGHLIHHKWQTWLDEMGLLSGHWKCAYCGHVTSLGLRPPLCPNCNDKILTYAEVPLSAESHNLIAGHADGYIPEYQALIEIKSIGLGTLRIDAPELLRKYVAVTDDGRKIPDLDAIWKALEEPLESHVKQAQIYLWLAYRSGLAIHKMVFLYEFKANQQVKELVIRRDPLEVAPLLAAADDITAAVRGSAPPPRRAHPQDSTPCNHCPFTHKCWSADEDPDQGSPVLANPARIRRAAGGEGAGVQGDRPGRPAGGDDAGTAGGRHRTLRRGTDAPVRTDDRLGGVRGGPTGTGRGTRTLRRGSAGRPPLDGDSDVHR